MEYEAVVRAFRRVGVKETVLKQQRGNMDRILSNGDGYGLLLVVLVVVVLLLVVVVVVLTVVHCCCCLVAVVWWWWWWLQ
jgi:uncharacterized membrane protein